MVMELPRAAGGFWLTVLKMRNVAFPGPETVLRCSRRPRLRLKVSLALRIAEGLIYWIIAQRAECDLFPVCFFDVIGCSFAACGERFRDQVPSAEFAHVQIGEELIHIQT